MVTGTSVIALKYDGGVLVAADTLASYGKLSKYRDTRRLFEMKSTIIGAGGDISDFTAIKETLSNLATAEYDHNDGHYLSPRNIWLFLGNLFYSRRNKFNPLWNSCVVAGFDKGKSYLFLTQVPWFR